MLPYIGVKKRYLLIKSWSICFVALSTHLKCDLKAENWVFTLRIPNSFSYQKLKSDIEKNVNALSLWKNAEKKQLFMQKASRCSWQPLSLLHTHTHTQTHTQTHIHTYTHTHTHTHEEMYCLKVAAQKFHFFQNMYKKYLIT